MKNNKQKVSLRGGFSDRNGIKKENTLIQYRDLDYRTRVEIINFINAAYNAVYHVGGGYEQNEEQVFWRQIKSNVYLCELDFNIYSSIDRYEGFEMVKNTIMEDEYDDVLTVLEYAINLMLDSKLSYRAKNLPDYLNKVFTKEYVGYRYIDRQIVPITDENEIKAINETINIKYLKAREHIEKALALLSDRKNPDYENSIKESISAVEALCNEISGKNASLGETLKRAENKGVKIHPALKSAFEKLYGYTSDASGIRHAGSIGGSEATFEEAKFMLVSCSAFINYLIGVNG